METVKEKSEATRAKPLNLKRGYCWLAGITMILVGLSFLIVWMIYLWTWWSITAAGWLGLLFAAGSVVLKAMADELLEVIKPAKK